MGQLGGTLTLHTMQFSHLHICVLVFSYLIEAAPSDEKEVKEARTNYNSGPQCTDETVKKCKKIPQVEEHEECHEEEAEIVDTEYEEICEDVVTTHCEEFSQTVPDSYRLQYSGYGSVLLDTHQGQLYSSVPKCEDKTEKQCKKVPKQVPQKVPQKVCEIKVDTKEVEECVDVIVTNCIEIHKEVSREVRILGTESYLLPPGQEYEPGQAEVLV